MFVFQKLQNFWVAKAPRNELLYSLTCTFGYLHNMVKLGTRVVGIIIRKLYKGIIIIIKLGCIINFFIKMFFLTMG